MKRVLIILFIITQSTIVFTEDSIYDFSKLKSIAKKILNEDAQLNMWLNRYIAQTKKNGNGAQYFRLDKSGKVTGYGGSGFDENIEIAQEKALNKCRGFNNSTNCHLIALNDKIVFTGKVNNFYLYEGDIVSKNEFLLLRTASPEDNSHLNEDPSRQIDESVSKIETSNVSEETIYVSGTKDKLRELKSMLDEGLISEEQYDEKSSKILDDF